MYSFFSETSLDASTDQSRSPENSKTRRMWHVVVFKKPFTRLEREAFERSIATYANNPRIGFAVVEKTPLSLSEQCLEDMLVAPTPPSCASGSDILTDNKPFLWVANPYTFARYFIQTPSHYTFVTLTLGLIATLGYLLYSLSRHSVSVYSNIALTTVSGVQFGTLFSLLYHTYAITLPSPILTSIVVQGGTLIGCMFGILLTRRSSGHLLQLYILIGVVLLIITSQTSLASSLLYFESQWVRACLTLFFVAVPTALFATLFPRAISDLMNERSMTHVGFALNSIGIAIAMYVALLCMIIYGISALLVLVSGLALASIVLSTFLYRP